MSKQTTKERVMEAAVQLFFQKGFHATTTRDITNRVGVNGSLISYHFNGKQGLLEEIVMSYYEQLIACIEQAMNQAKEQVAPVRLKKVIEGILKFKQENFHHSVVVHRELSLDSIFVREVQVIYITKENYYLHQLLSACSEEAVRANNRTELLTMQLKGMLNAPFTLHHEWKRGLFSVQMDARAFLHYRALVQTWIDQMIDQLETVPSMMY